MKIIREEADYGYEYENPKAVFEMMADFVTKFDARYLTEDQHQALLGILEHIADDKLVEELKAKRSTSDKKQYAGAYYMKNKQRLKNHKEQMKHKVEGKTRERMDPIMAKKDQTPTGKKKLSYNT